MAEKDYLLYGGNTSCVSVEFGGRLVVFDCGSGMVRLGQELESWKGRKRLDIFFSHVHIDHMIGLFGFPQMYDRSWELHMYGEKRNGMSFEEQLSRLVGPPYWPVKMKDFQADIEIHEIEAGSSIYLSDKSMVRTLRGNHSDISLLYLLEDEKRKAVYGLDCEMDEKMFKEMAEFCRDADAVIWDAQYTEEELKEKKGWGHSSWQQGVRLKEAAGAKRVIMSHYSWEYTDDQIREQEKLLEGRDAGCIFGKEGMEICL